MAYVLVIFPRLKPKPVFDLMDPETGIERLKTAPEVARELEYQELRHDYRTVEEAVDAWPLSGKYKRVIAAAAPVVTKDGKEYQIACLDASRVRMDPEDLKGEMLSHNFDLLNRHIDAVFKYVDDPRAWLTETGYEIQQTEISPVIPADAGTEKELNPYETVIG